VQNTCVTNWLFASHCSVNCSCVLCPGVLPQGGVGWHIHPTFFPGGVSGIESLWSILISFRLYPQTLPPDLGGDTSPHSTHTVHPTLFDLATPLPLSIAFIYIIGSEVLHLSSFELSCIVIVVWQLYINEVTLCQAQLALGWAFVFRWVYRPILQAFSSAVFRICGASRSPASAELLVKWLMQNNLYSFFTTRMANSAWMYW